MVFRNFRISRKERFMNAPVLEVTETEVKTAPTAEDLFKNVVVVEAEPQVREVPEPA
jgi:hypothetical protein